MNQEIIKDIVIIGAGPAGLSAAVYAGRAKLDTVLLEKGFQGGQLLNTEEVDNYLGIMGTTGPELSMRMYEHAREFGIEPINEEVVEIQVEGSWKKVITAEKTYKAKTVILGLGATPKQLGVPNEQALWGKGVSYCAICDGGFFREKTVAVVGGGDTAVEDALYLSRIAKKVYLIHRRDELRANKTLQNHLFNSGVEILWNSAIEELHEEGVLRGMTVYNKVTEERQEIEVNGVFIAIGSNPSTQLVKDLVQLNEAGYIIAGEDCQTSVGGIFVAGDARQKPLRQIITAASDGAVSVYEAEKFILEHF